MAQYDVYENIDKIAGTAKPYLLDVQSDLLHALATRVVVPLIPVDHISRPVEILNPVVQILNKSHYVSSLEIHSIPVGLMGRKFTRLADQHHGDIQNALAFLFADQ